MTKLLMIAAGGAIGALARYAITYLVGKQWGNYFPYGTLVVNIIGCFLIGVIMGLINEKLWIQPAWRFVLTIGFLGALTTFSSFSFETIKLIEHDHILYAIANVSANIILGLLVTWGGLTLIRL